MVMMDIFIIVIMVFGMGLRISLMITLVKMVKQSQVWFFSFVGIGSRVIMVMIVSGVRYCYYLVEGFIVLCL